MVIEVGGSAGREYAWKTNHWGKPPNRRTGVQCVCLMYVTRRLQCSRPMMDVLVVAKQCRKWFKQNASTCQGVNLQRNTNEIFKLELGDALYLFKLHCRNLVETTLEIAD